jgi:cation diffusion facilitator family transporter
VEYAKTEQLGRRIALVSTIAGAALAAAKIIVGVHAGSTAVLSDGLEASGDVLSSAIVYAGLGLARKPPDSEHPYGHGRYETIAGLGVGALLLLAGAGIFWHSLSFHQTSAFPVYTLYPLFAAIVIKILLAATKFRIAKRIASTSLHADGWHDITDLLSTCVALIAVGLTLADPVRFAAADHAGGLLIGLLIFFLSIQVVRRTIGQLLDTMPDDAKMAEIRRAALAVPGALGIEKCFARRTGLQYHVDLHLEVDPEMTVRESHEIATRVRVAVKESLPWVADVLVHVEPSPEAASPEWQTLLERSHGK